MFYREDLELLEVSELVALKGAINDRLDKYRTNAEDKDKFEERLNALRVMVEAVDPENEEKATKAKLLDAELAELEREVAYADEFEDEIEDLYHKINAHLPAWRRWLNRLLGGRRRLGFNLRLIVRPKVRDRFTLRIGNVGIGKKYKKIF